MFGFVVGMDLFVELSLELFVVNRSRRAQHMAAFLCNLERVGPDTWIVRNEDVSLLTGTPGLPTDESPNCLPEEQFG